jgi:AraC-like DNA-binding protein
MAGAREGVSPPNRSEGVAPAGPISVRADTPEEYVERMSGLVPGLRARATTALGFRSRLRGWHADRFFFASIRIDHARVLFPPTRGYAGFTVPLHSGFAARSGRRIGQFAPGAAHLFPEEDAVVEIEPRPGSHLLGGTLERSLLESYRQAYDGCWGGRPKPLEPLLRTSTPAGHRLLRYLDWIWRELTRPDSFLHRPNVVREVEDALAGMLVEACFAGDAPAPMAVSHAAARRAEDFLAAHLDRPLSLPELAETVGVSIRSLCRAFHDRHGMGPIAFLRRRRLEAARRDLIDAEPGQSDVTRVALRYGFAHLGRFAVDYNKMFGEPPSKTLCR